MAELETNINTETETTETLENVNTDQDSEQGDSNAELAKLRAEFAKQKAALDKATKEAGDAKKALRARQSVEEQAAEAQKEELATLKQQLEELTKERTVAVTSKSVFAFVQDEAAANTIANALYGANDVDAALSALGKAWAAKEKQLKLEYGKVPAPGAGGTDGPTITKAQLDQMKYTDRLEFANKYPDEYSKLMGR